MLPGNLNVRQATLQQVFKVTTICIDTHFQSFSPLISRIVHHALLKINLYCINKPMPKLRPYRGLLDTLLRDAPPSDAVINRI